jgi:mannosyltransferase OCH1-like enzyme
MPIKSIINNHINPVFKKQELQILKTINKPYPLKKSYNNIIPLNIFQTWHTKNLPPKMQKVVNDIKYNNPKFNYYLYDDNDCREFIKNNFNSDVLYAFDNLIPGAYKADLWRYCILYKLGGIYLDIKYKPVNGFKFINLTEKQHLVLDRDNYGIYNALMVCLPNNNYLLTAINSIVYNVKNKIYGDTSLCPTGPHLLAKIMYKNYHAIDMYHDFYLSIENRYIMYNNFIIFKSYNGYLDEHNKYKKQEYYGALWSKRKIYNE